MAIWLIAKNGVVFRAVFIYALLAFLVLPNLINLPIFLLG